MLPAQEPTRRSSCCTNTRPETAALKATAGELFCGEDVWGVAITGSADGCIYSVFAHRFSTQEVQSFCVNIFDWTLALSRDTSRTQAHFSAAGREHLQTKITSVLQWRRSEGWQ